jgi:MFS family permease
VQGFASSSGSLASIVGLILGGFLYEVLDGSAFLIAGLVIYTALLLNFRLRHFEKRLAINRQCRKSAQLSKL